MHSRVYIMRKHQDVFERIGTLTLCGISQALSKVAVCVGGLMLIGLLRSWQECILLSASVLATETRSVTEILRDRQLPANIINFFQAESLVVNTLLIIVSYTLHPFSTHSVMAAHSLLFRLFANLFFSFLIGTTWAFLASYSLKRSYGKL